MCGELPTHLMKVWEDRPAATGSSLHHLELLTGLGSALVRLPSELCPLCRGLSSTKDGKFELLSFLSLSRNDCSFLLF